jgi:hypothetical protein
MARATAREDVMEYDKDKVDDMMLALLFLTTFEDGPILRAWKGMARDISDRLHEKGYIGNPKGKTKSVVLTDEGAKRSEELFEKYFGK